MPKLACLFALVVLFSIAGSIAARDDDIPAFFFLLGQRASSPVVALFNKQLENYVAAAGNGARLSIAPLGGHEPGDTFRTQFAVETMSDADATVEETSTIFEMSAVSGYAPPWAAGTAYGKQAQVKGDDGSVFAPTHACASGKGPPPKLTDLTKLTNSDGGCAWRHLGIGAGAGRSAQLLTTNVYGPSGGEAWGQAIMLGVKSGVWPNGGGFGVGQEIDVGNENRDCPPSIHNGCQIYGSFINGNGTRRSTLGVFIGGEKGFHVALQLAGTAASDIAIADATHAATGFYQNGQHEVSYVDRSQAQTGISLEGKYARAQIAGTGWSISPTGSISAHAIRETVSAPPTSSQAPCQEGEHAWDANYEYRCIARNSWKRSALSAW